MESCFPGRNTCRDKSTELQWLKWGRSPGLPLTGIQLPLSLLSPRSFLYHGTKSSLRQELVFSTFLHHLRTGHIIKFYRLYIALNPLQEVAFETTSQSQRWNSRDSDSNAEDRKGLTGQLLCHSGAPACPQHMSHRRGPPG